MRKFKTRSIVLAGCTIAVVAAPWAGAAGEGTSVRGGVRNPSPDPSRALTRETQIIADSGTYGTRQSNKSDNGGGAIYGCRSKAGGTVARNEPCIRSNNLADGFAFEFATKGAVAGLITVGRGGDGARPFTTNATGVATGLNADRVDGRNGEDLLAKTDKAADADKLDGRDSAEFAGAGDLLFAAVAADATVSASRGGTTSATYDAAGNTFTVTFPKDVSKCSFTATQTGAAAADVDLAVDPVSGAGTRVTVDQTGATAVPFHLQVIC